MRIWIRNHINVKGRIRICILICIEVRSRIRILPFTLIYVQILACNFDADPVLDPTTHFFPDLDPPMLQSDPIRLPPFHFDADLDPLHWGMAPFFTIHFLQFYIAKYPAWKTPDLDQAISPKSGSATLVVIALHFEQKVWWEGWDE